jgi:hypothetical protein
MTIGPEPRTRIESRSFRLGMNGGSLAVSVGSTDLSESTVD